jgi:hypothetical protein
MKGDVVFCYYSFGIYLTKHFIVSKQTHIKKHNIKYSYFNYFIKTLKKQHNTLLNLLTKYCLKFKQSDFYENGE